MSLELASGQRFTPARANRLVPRTAMKGSNTSKTSDATLANDTSLALTLKAGVTYELTGNLIVNSAANAAGDFQMCWSWTGSATVHRGTFGVSGALASGTAGDGEWSANTADSTSPGPAASFGASTSNTSVRIFDRIVVGSADITLTLQWAQASSNASATTLFAGSRITATPVA